MERGVGKEVGVCGGDLKDWVVEKEVGKRVDDERSRRKK